MPTIQQQINQLKKDKETLNTMLNTMGVETTGNETFTQLTPLVGKIVTDPILQDKTIEIVENGTTNITADEGYDGLNNVEVITNVTGSGGGDQEGGLIDGTITKISNDRVTTVRSSAFLDLKSLKEVNLPNVLKINNDSFKGCNNIKTFNAPKVTEIGSYSFANIYYTDSYDFPELIILGNYAFNNNSLKTINLPKITKVSYCCFQGCSKLETVDFPNATTTGGSTFKHSTSLKNVNLPKLTSIGTNDFYGCSLLDTIILKNETMCTLANTNAFTNTKIVSGTGYIYVPKALIEDYKVATNWTTYANQFRAIEDYPEICGEVTQ